MDTGSRVTLRTFNGTLDGPLGTRRPENYWLLVGSAGTVRGFSEELGRYLVQFDTSVTSLGLHCHNLEANSLYIAPRDLAVSESGPEA